MHTKLKKYFTAILFLFITAHCFSQKSITDFGYRHFTIVFQQDTVDIIVKSKKGEELKKKPLLFFAQGSSTKPFITYDDKNVYYSTPLEGLVEDNYHLVIVNKPGIPMTYHRDSLIRKNRYLDKATGKHPKKFTDNNHLEYYVERNDKVLKYLLQKNWADTTKVVASGHSQGSSIALYMASSNKKITHLIYSSGTPYFSRILAMVAEDRLKEKDSASSYVEKVFSYWQRVQNNPFDVSTDHGWNTYKGTESFSKNENLALKRLKIPVLISYGSKDVSCLFNDMFRIETIKENIGNIRFKAFIGLEHSYFHVLPNGQVDYSQYSGDKVVTYWLNWLANN